jgi:branched-chain amino acid transport system ATP-binding protein
VSGAAVRVEAASVDADAGAPAIAVSGLVVRYGAVEAVRAVDLRIGPGRSLAVLGPNGAGKTSLLRAISGLVRPAAGEVRIGGLPNGTLPASRIARRGLAHVPEGRGVIAPLTVRENLLMGAHRVPRKEIADLEQQMVELFPVLGRRNGVAAGLLSGGEQQMLAIARGLMSRPKVLMIDEPSMGLAPVVVDDVVDGLRRAVASSGTALLLVEQNLQTALDLADQVAVMVGGRIMLSRPREEVPADVIEMYVDGERGADSPPETSAEEAR